MMDDQIKTNELDKYTSVEAIADLRMKNLVNYLEVFAMDHEDDLMEIEDQICLIEEEGELNATQKESIDLITKKLNSMKGVFEALESTFTDDFHHSQGDHISFLTSSIGPSYDCDQIFITPDKVEVSKSDNSSSETISRVTSLHGWDKIVEQVMNYPFEKWNGKSYSSPALDGGKWELSMRMKNKGVICLCEGRNAYPSDDGSHAITEREESRFKELVSTLRSFEDA